MADCRAACDLAMVMLVVVGGFIAAGIVSPCCEVCLAVCCRSGVWPGLLRWVPGFLVHLILELNGLKDAQKFVSKGITLRQTLPLFTDIDILLEISFCLWL